MNMRKQTDQQFRKKWKSIRNFLYYNTGYELAGVARAGSRRQGDWKTSSDLDIRFAIVGNPSRSEVYPDLRNKLKKCFSTAKIRIGSSKKVINMKIGNLDFDLIPLSTTKFKQQIQNDRLRRL